MTESRRLTSEQDSTSILHQGLPLPSTIRQIDGIQILRAAAVILVAWVHITQEATRFSSKPMPSLGVFGIDIFFVISGFILGAVVMRSQRSPGLGAAWHFFSRRVLRIFPIYWLFSLYGLVRLLHSGAHLSLTIFSTLLLLPFPFYPHDILLVPNGWTLVFEWFFYCSLAAVQLFTIRRAVYVLLVGFTVLAALSLVVPAERPVLLVVFNPILLEFCFGIVLAVAYKKWGTIPFAGKALLVLGCVMALWIQAAHIGVANGLQMILTNDHAFARVFTWGIAATLIVLGMLLWQPATGRIGRFFVVLGNASYSIYLAEGLLTEVSFRLADHVHRLKPMQGAVSAYVLVLGILALKLGGGWLVYQFVEYPMLRKLQSLLGMKA